MSSLFGNTVQEARTIDVHLSFVQLCVIDSFIIGDAKM